MERGDVAPYLFFIRRAHILLAARYFAISSKKSMCELKKNEMRGTNSSTFNPRAMPAST